MSEATATRDSEKSVKQSKMDDLKKDDSNSEDQEMLEAPKQKKILKKGLIYVSNLPKHMNVTRIREILGQYAEVGRVFLIPEKVPGGEKLCITRLLNNLVKFCFRP